MDSDSDSLKAALVALLVMLAAGVAGYGGYMAGQSVKPQPEDVSPRPEVEQGDGSRVLRREPAATPPPAPHAIPKGATRERQVQVDVKPRATQGPDGACECDPVRVDLSLVRDGSGRRVIASAQGGKVIGGLDIPIERAILADSYKWAFGATYDPFKDSAGLAVERDFGRIRLGVDVYEHKLDNERSEAALRLRLLWRF